MSREHTPGAPLLLAGLSLGNSTAIAGVPAQSQTHSFTVPAACERLFPLFTAEGERTWAPGWEPEMLSGSVERGSVFRTHGAGRETVWVVTEYSPAEGRVSYARIAQGSNIGLVDVRCSRSGPQASEIIVTYTLTGISPEGKEYVDQFFGGDAYTDYIEEWRDGIMAYLGAAR
jgi:hypothetical protein